MARGVRAYARSRGVSRGTVAAAIAAGTIPLLPSGDIDTARADAEWLPYWRPMTGPNPYAPPPDPDAEAWADAALRRGLIDTGMPEGEAAELVADLERLLQS